MCRVGVLAHRLLPRERQMVGEYRHLRARFAKLPSSSASQILDQKRFRQDLRLRDNKGINQYFSKHHPDIKRFAQTCAAVATESRDGHTVQIAATRNTANGRSHELGRTCRQFFLTRLYDKLKQFLNRQIPRPAGRDFRRQIARVKAHSQLPFNSKRNIQKVDAHKDCSRPCGRHFGEILIRLPLEPNTIWR
jgi:hypothetical protein